MTDLQETAALNVTASNLTPPGKIFLVNGASSAGKSTLCRALQAALDEPYWHFSIDHLRDSGVLPLSRIQQGDFDWARMRGPFFEGFHRSLAAFAGAGNNLIVEHIVENADAMRRLLQILAPFDVFFVGVHCPLEELERRERERGDRRIGDARHDHATVHTFGFYDFEVDSTDSLEANVAAIVTAWKSRGVTGAFYRMRREASGEE